MAQVAQVSVNYKWEGGTSFSKEVNLFSEGVAQVSLKKSISLGGTS